MKKILAGALALLASATMAFAEMSVGGQGTFNFGVATDMLPTANGGIAAGWGSMFSELTSKQLMLAGKSYLGGGFAIPFRTIWYAESGKLKDCYVGLQTGLGMTFRNENYEFQGATGTNSNGDPSDYQDSGVKVNVKFNTLDIPILFVNGGRWNGLEWGWSLGPTMHIPLGKAKFDIDDGIGLLAGLGVSSGEFKAGFGIGAQLGLNIGYNITQNHGVFLDYSMGFDYFIGTAGQDAVKQITEGTEPTYAGLELDLGRISLGYRYTF